MARWLCMLVVVGCGSPQPAVGPAPEKPATPDATRSPAQPDPGYIALLQQRDIQDQPVDRGEVAPATVVVVFASWCPACRHELKDLAEFRRKRPWVRVIGVNAHEEYKARSDYNRLRRFLAKAHPDLQVVIAGDELLKAFGGVPRVPSLFVFGSQGEIVGGFRPPHSPTTSDLFRIVDRLR